MPRGRRGLLQRAERLARQAADLEEEAKRTEAQAFYNPSCFLAFPGTISPPQV